jgi:hypothetical protein
MSFRDIIESMNAELEDERKNNEKKLEVAEIELESTKKQLEAAKKAGNEA